MKSKIANIWATYFGLGLSKFAPGTMGSLGTLPLAFAIMYYGNFYWLIAISFIIFIFGTMATAVIIEETGIDDPSKVVIDETVGQLLSFSFLAYIDPAILVSSTAVFYYLCGFILFRFFDILKMGPVKYFDSKVHNAYGVMLDDVFAGIFAAIALYIIWYSKILEGIF